MTEQESEDTVRGERSSAALASAPSLQTRVSNVLAIGLMSVLGLGMLTWYYANAITRQSDARQGAQASSAKRAQGGDIPLPSLGRIDPPTVQMPRPADPVTQPIPLSATPLREIPLEATPSAAAYGSPPVKTAAQLAQERQLSGAVFSAQSSPPTVPATGPMPPPAASQEPGELSALLRPSVTTTVRAQVLPTQRLLLPKGAFLDCTLETAIDSTLPGMTTCVMATDAFGVDGQVVLMERGTKLVGETRGQVQQGSARVFVLWNEAIRLMIEITCVWTHARWTFLSQDHAALRPLRNSASGATLRALTAVSAGAARRKRCAAKWRSGSARSSFATPPLSSLEFFTSSSPDFLS